MTVKLPSEAHAAMYLDVLLCGEEEGFAGRDSDSRGGDRQLGSVARERPGPVIGLGTGKFGGDVNIGQLVLDGLKRTDRAAEGITLERVVAGHLEGFLRAAHLLEGEQNGRAVLDAPQQ